MAVQTPDISSVEAVLWTLAVYGREMQTGPVFKDLLNLHCQDRSSIVFVAGLKIIAILGFAVTLGLLSHSASLPGWSLSISRSDRGAVLWKPLNCLLLVIQQAQDKWETMENNQRW